jgi:23S rRNA (cytidine1920-2'-O)/16S rRNA (cytidine1409-2'-O)-methyltransferase
VSRGLAESRTRAQALIMAGAVFSGERKLSKAGDLLAEDAPLEVRGKDHPWVSRGGIKLDHGLTHFDFDVTGAVALDVGSSTGGFTDVLLSRGASKVYAVDVGTNQLAWKLRQDTRVVVHEQTNARTLDSSIIPEPVAIIVCDASFISLTKVLEAPLKLAKPGAKLVALIKPQFEAGRGAVGKGGILRDEEVRGSVIEERAAELAGLGLERLGLHDSAVPGMGGNREAFALLRKGAA